MQEYQEIIKGIIKAKIVEAMTSEGELLENLIKSAIEDKVDEHGKPSSYGKTPYVDWIIGMAIREAVRAAVYEVMREHQETVLEVIREKVSVEEIHKSFMQLIGDVAKDDWRMIIKFGDKDDR